MENQHRKISGYRELSQTEIDLMNRIKSFGPQLQILCEDLEVFIKSQASDASPADLELKLRLQHAKPREWIIAGRHSLQIGLMELTRAIAQPEFF